MPYLKNQKEKISMFKMDIMTLMILELLRFLKGA